LAKILEEGEASVDAVEGGENSSSTSLPMPKAKSFSAAPSNLGAQLLACDETLPTLKIPTTPLPRLRDSLANGQIADGSASDEPDLEQKQDERTSTTADSTTDENLNQDLYLNDENIKGSGLDPVGCALAGSNNATQVQSQACNKQDKVLWLRPVQQGLMMAPPQPLPPALEECVSTNRSCVNRMESILGFKDKKNKQHEITSTRTDDNGY